MDGQMYSMRTLKHGSMHICACVRMCMLICACCNQVHTIVSMYVYTYIYIYIYTYTYTYVHMHTHTYIPIHTHTHEHTQGHTYQHTHYARSYLHIHTTANANQYNQIELGLRNYCILYYRSYISSISRESTPDSTATGTGTQIAICTTPRRT
jgi:hypothetical protein